MKARLHRPTPPNLRRLARPAAARTIAAQVLADCTDRSRGEMALVR